MRAKIPLLKPPCHSPTCTLHCCGLKCRGSKEHSDFWSFFHHYHKFSSQHGEVGKEHSKHDEYDPKRKTDLSSKFGLPRVYDRSYRIGFSVVPPDLPYQLRRLQERRRDDGLKESTLTDAHLTQFRTILRHFINFQQKRKVTK